MDVGYEGDAGTARVTMELDGRYHVAVTKKSPEPRRFMTEDDARKYAASQVGL